MAAEDPFSRTSDATAIGLLRSLRAGTVDRCYVHRVDVCAAAPEDLVANLEPVPGTDLAEDGYSSTWYFYCPKRYKNTQGKQSGHRQRAIAGGDTCWHSETRPKPVKGLDGATLCTLSYGRKEGSSRSFNRMGWCMTEYDVIKEESGGGDDHVLCKVHRSSSSLARGKLKPSSSSTKTASSEQMTQRSSSSKRKATADQVQTRPIKISHAQASACDYACFNQDINSYMDDHVKEQQFCRMDHQEQFDFDPMLSLSENDQETMPVDHQEQNDFDPMLLLKVDDGSKSANTGPLTPRTQAILNDLIRTCCTPPAAAAPPDAASFEFEALAFRYLAQALTS